MCIREQARDGPHAIERRPHGGQRALRRDAALGRHALALGDLEVEADRRERLTQVVVQLAAQLAALVLLAREQPAREHREALGELGLPPLRGLALAAAVLE